MKLLRILSEKSYRILVLSIAALALVGAADGPMSRAEARRQAAGLTELGRRLFADPALSASGRLSCAACHDPARGFGPPDDAPVRAGGADLAKPGIRAVPSLTYLQATPAFTEHFFESEDEGDESVDNGPTGGLTWDGRVDRGRAQARIPLFSPFEMANGTAAALAQRLRRAGYAAALGKLLHKPLDRPPALVEAALAALEAYEQDPAGFYPYSSKYDFYLAGKAVLSPQEARGLALFEDPAKGNCAQCHISARGKDGTPPQFTDYGLIALGVPRNKAIPANADPGYFDLGLCGPVRTDFTARAEYCGLFKTPSLRNTALRPVFMHNGVFRSLRDVVEFYAERDTTPEKWYGPAGKFDDLPPAYWKNINTDPPFGGHPGDRPALDAQEIDAIVAFLGTLTDGYAPP